MGTCGALQQHRSQLAPELPQYRRYWTTVWYLRRPREHRGYCAQLVPEQERSVDDRRSDCAREQEEFAGSAWTNHNSTKGSKYAGYLCRTAGPGHEHCRRPPAVRELMTQRCPRFDEE